MQLWKDLPVLGIDSYILYIPIPVINTSNVMGCTRAAFTRQETSDGRAICL